MKSRNLLSNKKINNPFIKEKNREKFKKKCFLCSFFIIFISFLFLYFIFWTNLFKINSIEVSSLNRINSEEIEEIIDSQIKINKIGIFSQSNLLIFSKRDALKFLEKYNFLSLKICKKIPKSLKIEIKEREIVSILEENDIFYYLDGESNIVSENKICENLELLDNVQDKNQENIEIDTARIKDFCSTIKFDFLKDQYYPLIINEGQSRVNVDLMFARLDGDYLTFMNRIYNDLGIESDFRVKNFIIDESRETIKFRLHNGVLVFFNLKDDYNSQIKRFLLLRNEYRDNLTGVEYIDIRYGEKIYYK